MRTTKKLFYEFEGDIVQLDKVVRSQPKSGVIYVPRRYIGKEVTVIIKE